MLLNKAKVKHNNQGGSIAAAGTTAGSHGWEPDAFPHPDSRFLNILAGVVQESRGSLLTYSTKQAPLPCLSSPSRLFLLSLLQAAAVEPSSPLQPNQKLWWWIGLRWNLDGHDWKWEVIGGSPGGLESLVDVPTPGSAATCLLGEVEFIKVLFGLLVLGSSTDFDQ